MAWAVPGALASLETLIVSANNFSGSLPTEWGINPVVFSALKTLDVRQNGFAGYLPDAWGAGFQVLLMTWPQMLLCCQEQALSRKFHARRADAGSEHSSLDLIVRN